MTKFMIDMYDKEPIKMVTVWIPEEGYPKTKTIWEY